MANANEEIEINDQILNDGGLDVTTYSTTIDNGDGGRPVIFDLPYTEDDEYSATRDESIVSSTILQRYKQGTTNKKKNWVMISLATVALACIIGVIVSVSSDSLRTKNSVNNNNSNTVSSSSIPAMPWVVDQESVASEVVDDGAPEPEEDGAYRLYTDRQIGTASAKAEKEATLVRCGKSGKGSSKGSTSKGGTGKSGKSSKSSKAKSGKSGSGKAGKGSKADADCPSTKSNKGSATKAEKAASTKGKGGTRMLLLRNSNLKQRKNHRTVKGRD